MGDESLLRIDVVLSQGINLELHFIELRRVFHSSLVILQNARNQLDHHEGFVGLVLVRQFET